MRITEVVYYLILFGYCGSTLVPNFTVLKNGYKKPFIENSCILCKFAKKSL